jgi:hypothetical protein
MLPEISRRCLSCGAAVRAGSRFCQQCGKALEAGAASPSAPGEPDAAEARASVPPKGEWPPQEQVAPATEDWTPPIEEFAAFERPAAVAEPLPPLPPERIEDAGVEGEPAAPVAVAQELSEEPARGSDEAAEAADEGQAGDLRGRVARVREGTRARVGRMREEAIVVLEETPDDSGLRFVAAAAALFVLFLVLLFLSTTLLR